MATTGLEVRVHEGRERAEVSRVAHTLNTVVWSLREIDRVHLLRGTRATWVMADMERDAHDLVMRLETRFVPANRDHDDMLVPAVALVEGAEVLQREPTVPRLFAPSTVQRLASLAAPAGGVQGVTLATYNGALNSRVELTDGLRVHASQAVKPFEVTHGSVSGMLSGLRDTKKKSLRVTVRDENGKQAVDGFVPEAMTEELRHAWRHRVLLSGKVKRNSRGQAIRIDVDRIERLPEGNAGRPSTEALLGAGANWLDGLTVDQLLEELESG